MSRVGPPADDPVPVGLAVRHSDPAVVAIAAAVEICWPREALGSGKEPDRTPAWRFSGRWWSGPAQRRRQRPSVAPR